MFRYNLRARKERDLPLPKSKHKQKPVRVLTKKRVSGQKDLKRLEKMIAKENAVERLGNLWKKKKYTGAPSTRAPTLDDLNEYEYFENQKPSTSKAPISEIDKRTKRADSPKIDKHFRKVDPKIPSEIKRPEGPGYWNKLTEKYKFF